MKLVVRKEGTFVAGVTVGDAPLSLGRSKKNDLVLSDNLITRHHAKIERNGDVLILEDLGTTNGTKVRGHKIKKAKLKEGDSFQIGPFEITLEPGIQEVRGDDATPLKMDPPAADLSHVSTRLEKQPPSEKTKEPPPESPDSESADSQDFMEAIAVRPRDADDRTPSARSVLENFLEKKSKPGSQSMQELSDLDPSEGEISKADALPIESNARLVRLDGKKAGEEIPLQKEEFTLGRAPENDLVLEEEMAAPFQATLQKREDSFVLRGQQGSTGTFVDGALVEERELQSHDVIEVGGSQFEFLQGSARSRAKRPGVIERSPQSTKSASSFLLDWRFLLVAGAALGILFVLFAPKPPSQRHVVQPTPAPTATVDMEKNRLVRFHLDRASQALGEKQYKKATTEVQLVLDKIAPNHPDAHRLMKEIETEKKEIRRQKEKGRREKERLAEKIQGILEEGERLLEAKKYGKARRVYEQILLIDANHKETRKVLQKIEKLAAAEQKRKKERAARHKKLDNTYQKGVMQFEAGNLGGADVLLSNVAEEKGHRFQASARKLLKEIHRRVDVELAEKLDNAQVLLEDGQIIEAYEMIEPIVKQFPRSAKAKKLLSRANHLRRKRSKELFKEGLAYWEIVEDPELALEKFREVLKYSSNPNSAYHKKARAKITEIQKAAPAETE